ncbi:prepilin-type N-terminal cleavage/methylation domain-containing protein [uncultured Gimesia sp.]|uniref:type IV pilus modification PilV family protein n=1 Tax=uncultured Gimesia sp. TaxID=1678688 RepID=UPI0030DD1D1E|tara:strand:+ start:125444 stop:126049 length:606 start_codon:yes stop_codon:yes gene_type:complete
MATRKQWLQRSRRNGFTLVESLVSVTITAIAGVALFSAIGASLGASYSALNHNVGTGLADQLLEELAAVRFPTSSDTRPHSTGKRKDFDDLDDYDNWSASPPVNKEGYPLGNEPVTILEYYLITRPSLLVPDTSFLGRLRREVSVERIKHDNGSGWVVTNDETDFRRVTVTIKLAMTTDAGSRNHVISEATRIFSYVPLSP